MGHSLTQGTVAVPPTLSLPKSSGRGELPLAVWVATASDESLLSSQWFGETGKSALSQELLSVLQHAWGSDLKGNPTSQEQNLPSPVPAMHTCLILFSTGYSAVEWALTHLLLPNGSE